MVFMKKWISYKKALAKSGMRKAVFDRVFLGKGDHIRIQDDGKLLFSKRFLDFPNGHTVFSEITRNDGTTLRFEDNSFHEELVFDIAGTERVITCKKKWLTYWEAIDYTGMDVIMFDTVYLGSFDGIVLENGKLRFRKRYLKQVVRDCEHYNDPDDVTDTYCACTVIASRFCG